MQLRMKAARIVIYCSSLRWVFNLRQTASTHNINQQLDKISEDAYRRQVYRMTKVEKKVMNWACADGIPCPSIEAPSGRLWRIRCLRHLFSASFINYVSPRVRWRSIMGENYTCPVTMKSVSKSRWNASTVPYMTMTNLWREWIALHTMRIVHDVHRCKCE